MNHADLFPNADPRNPEHRKSKEQWAKELERDIEEGGYTSKRLEAADKSVLKRIRKWLALPV